MFGDELIVCVRFNTPGRSRPCCTSDNLFETDQWVEMIQVNECGLRESLGKKKEVFNGGTSLFWEDCECVLRCGGIDGGRFDNRPRPETPARNIYTVVRDCDRKYEYYTVYLP